MALPELAWLTSGPLPSKPRGGSGPRHQARSADTAEIPGRNESLVDLVPSFQTQKMTAQPIAPQPQPQCQPQPQPSDKQTALPVAISPIESKPGPKQDLKPFHRRLLQLAQRPKRKSTSNSRKQKQQLQIEALIREGYLIPAHLPKVSKGQKEAKQLKGSLSLSVSRSLSKSKKDVENIGQPWLEAKADDRKRPTEVICRLESLDLDNFGSMVDVAVPPASDFDVLVPPPYRSTDSGPSQSSSTMPMSSSMAEANPFNIIKPASSLASTSHYYRNVSIDEQVQRPSSSEEPNTRATSQNTKSVSKATSNAPAGANDTASQPRASCDSFRGDQIDQSSVRNVTPSQHTLTLFPDVVPPRKSSMAAWRASEVPRYQTINNVAGFPALPISSSQSGSSDNTTEFSGDSRTSSDVFTDIPASVTEPRCSGPLVHRAASAAAASAEKAPNEPASPDTVKARPSSFSMNTLKTFPPPAPTRPPPSLPEFERSPSVPPDFPARSIRFVRSGPISSTSQTSSEVVPEAQETESVIDSARMLDSCPAAVLGSIEAGGSMADDEQSLYALSISDYYRPTPGVYTARGGASSIRIPRMQELPETRNLVKASEGQPLADYPVLRHGTPTQTNAKHALKGLHNNYQVFQKNISFGLPSPPPTAPLPPAPPPQNPPPPPPGCRIGQGNATAPHAAELSPMKSIWVSDGPGFSRNSMVSQNDSSRCSRRNKSSPDSYEESRPESRRESRVSSSGDEFFSPAEDFQPSRREPSQHMDLQAVCRGYETADANQTSSRPRLRYPQSTHSMTPQSHSNHNLERTLSQSRTSQSTQRSGVSQNSHSPRASPAQIDHYLEGRVANLERQNQIFQAALIVALNATGKDPLESLNLDPNMTPAFQHDPYASNYSSRHSSRWISFSRSSEHSGFKTSSSYKDGRANAKQLDNMVEDIESRWMSDKSSLSGARIIRKR
jgi:hypothetical protein